MIKKVLIWCLVIMSVFCTVSFAEPETEASEPTVYGQAAILIDMDTGRILYEKNIDEKVYPASTTKIMTAALILEKYNDKLDEVVVASDVVSSITGTAASNIGIRPGEELTVKQLLYAIMVASANEACDVLAEHMCGVGNVDEFVGLMNAKAKELGMEDTHFVNTHGFHDDNHYTTARDMAILTRYAMQNEKFREIVKTTNYVIPKTNKYTYGDGTRNLPNTNDLIKPGYSVYYKYATGVKTGFTSQAGNCLVASASKESTKSATKSEINLIAATFNSQDEGNVSRKNTDVTNLFEYGFNNYSIMSVSVPNEDVGEVGVYAGKDADVVTAVVSSEVKALLPADVDMKKDIKRNYSYHEDVKAPVSKGDVIGKVEYTYTDKKTGEVIYLGESALVAKFDVEKDTFKHVTTVIKNFITSWYVILPVILILAVMVVLAYMRNLRKRRRRQFLRNKRYGR